MPRALRTDGLSLTLPDGRRVRLLRNANGSATVFVRAAARGSKEHNKRVPVTPATRCSAIARYLGLMVGELPRELKNQLVGFDAGADAVATASMQLVPAAAAAGPLGLNQTAKGAGFEMRHGDAFTFAAELPRASVDAIVLDPPYGSTKGSGAKGCYKRSWDVKYALPPSPAPHPPLSLRRIAASCRWSASQWTSLVKNLWRALRPGGHVLLLSCTSGSITGPWHAPTLPAAKPATAFAHTGARLLPERPPVRGCRGVRIAPSRLLPPRLGTRGPQRQHTQSGSCTGQPRRPARTHQMLSSSPEADPRVLSQAYCHEDVMVFYKKKGITTLSLYQPQQRKQSSVLTYTKDARTKALPAHMKPVALMEELARRYAPPAGIVLDLAARTGVTGVGALLAGRRFVGCEADEAMFTLAVRWLTDPRVK